MTSLSHLASAGSDHTPLRPIPAEEGTQCMCPRATQVKLSLNSHLFANQHDAAQQGLEFSESASDCHTILPLLDEILGSVGESAAESYAKALASLRGFVEKWQLLYSPLSTTLIADWLITIRLNGISLSTIRLYLNAISSLHRRLHLASPLPDYSSLRSILQEIIRTDEALHGSAIRYNSPAEPSTHSHLRTEDIPASLLRHLRQAAIIAGGISLESAARLRRTDLEGYPLQLAETVAEYIDPRRRYIFPLNQSAYTPRQLARRIADAMSRSTDPQLRNAESPAMQWLRTALRCGATPSEAILTLGRDPLATHPDGAISRLLAAAPMPEAPDPEAPFRLRQLVAEAIADNPLQWYALHLRQGSDMDSLLGRLGNMPSAIPSSNLFYPMRPIAHRTPHGIRHGEEPVLPGILFIRLHRNRLQSILSDIADLAWCYRDAVGEGYARIPDVEIQAFQLAIGIFTPETDIYPLGTLTPHPDQQVVVLGGPFAGRTGRYRATVNPDTPTGQPILYRLILPADNGIEWEADLDPRLVGTAAV